MAKKNTKGIIIGAVVALAAIVTLAPSKKVDSIELSLPSYPSEYDINTEVPIYVSVLPENAKSDSIEYVASSDSITISDSFIYTGSVEGAYEIYAVSDNVKSNIVTVHVADISARIEAEKKAEEERLAKEAEEQRLAEEQAAKEAEEQRLAEEQAAKEAEEQRLAEEQAAKEAEKKAVAKQTARETVADTPETESAPQPIEEPVQIVEVQTEEIPVDVTAYLSATGKKYHSIDHCGKMNPDKAAKTTVSEAEKAGYDRCSKCW